MAGVNKVILVGNLGSDPELRYMPDGTSMAKVNLATTEVRRSQDGQRTEYTEWHRLTFFGRQAEIAGEYLHKGSKIYAEGSLRTRKWEPKEGGGTRTTVEIRVMQFIMLDSKGSRASRDEDSPAGSGGGRPPPKPRAPESGGKGGKSEAGGPFGGIDEDDIPF